MRIQPNSFKSLILLTKLSRNSLRIHLPNPKDGKQMSIMDLHSTAIHHHLVKDRRLVQSTTLHPMETRVPRHLMVAALAIRLARMHLPMDMDVTAIHNRRLEQKRRLHKQMVQIPIGMDNRKDSNTTRMVRPSMAANRQNPFILVKSKIRHTIMVRRILPIRQSSLHL